MMAVIDRFTYFEDMFGQQACIYAAGTLFAAFRVAVVNVIIPW